MHKAVGEQLDKNKNLSLPHTTPVSPSLSSPSSASTSFLLEELILRSMKVVSSLVTSLVWLKYHIERIQMQSLFVYQLWLPSSHHCQQHLLKWLHKSSLINITMLWQINPKGPRSWLSSCHHDLARRMAQSIQQRKRMTIMRDGFFVHQTSRKIPLVWLRGIIVPIFSYQDTRAQLERVFGCGL